MPDTNVDPAADPAQYRANAQARIQNCVEQMGCQPILFVGSGLSRRYLATPSWAGLLDEMGKRCPLIENEFAYFQQKIINFPEIGSEFAKFYREWAWGKGRVQFPSDLFAANVPADTYIKFCVSEFISNSTSEKIKTFLNGQFKNEIDALREIKPHALVTTNYDTMLEKIFSEYTPVVGQKILTGSALSVGEIFKIHGCISEHNSLVLTKEDYDFFTKRKKYLSAKLLTFFSEHPLIFIGYSATDKNIRDILSDIDEALPQMGGLIPNVFFVEWAPAGSGASFPETEKLIAVDEGRSVRVHCIQTDKFDWVFKTLGTNKSAPSVSARVLRTILARSYELVRSDIPRKMVEADFQFLEHAIANSGDFSKLFGITTIQEPSALSVTYPYTLSQVAARLKKKATWHYAHQLLEIIKRDKRFDIKSSDNKYHRTEKYGKGLFHKYSDAAINILAAVDAGRPYEL
jgi:hypothetical protein